MEHEWVLCSNITDLLVKMLRNQPLLGTEKQRIAWNKVVCNCRLVCHGAESLVKHILCGVMLGKDCLRAEAKVVHQNVL